MNYPLVLSITPQVRPRQFSQHKMRSIDIRNQNKFGIYQSLILLGVMGIPMMYSCRPVENLPARILWYDHPAEHFEEALPLGNGRIGAVV